MKKITFSTLGAIALLTAVITGSSCLAAVPSTGAGALALVNGTLIDGTGAKPLKKAAVVIRNGRITAVGKLSELTIPKRARVINVRGGTILPGLINTIVHNSYKAKTLKKWARAGVTTVRDLALNGTSFEQAMAFQKEALAHADYARVVSSGPIVTVPNGYPITVMDWPYLAVTSVDDARQKVSQLFDAGADTTTVALESGPIYGLSLPELTPAETEAIVELAHERGKTVSARLSVASDLKRALAAGVDDVGPVTDRLPDGSIKKMVASGTSMMSMLEVWNDNGFGDNLDSNLRRFLRAGGRVALGNAYGSRGTSMPIGMPITEIRLMHGAGMTPMQIIVAATKNAAHVCNLGKKLGTLERGKIADVLVVNGNPLQNVNALTKTLYVIHGGVIIRRP